jgi:hypothetical protein
MWKISRSFLSVGKSLDADATSVWKMITDTAAWTEWGPTLSKVDCAERFIKFGTQGRVKTAVGFWLPFQITEYSDRNSWSWRVGPFNATGHRIVKSDSRGCQLWFDTPILAAPYSLACQMALGRIERLLQCRVPGE